MMRPHEISTAAALLMLAPALYAQAPVAPPLDPATQAPPPDAVVGPAAAEPAHPTESTSAAPSAAAPPPAVPRHLGPAHWRRAPARASMPPTAAVADVTDDAARAEAAPLPTLSAWLGVGSLWIGSDGLDPFAKDDGLITFAAGAAWSLAAAGELDVSIAAGWDVTSSDERYRGELTSLGLMRFALGPELRGSILDRLFWHARLCPTFTRWSAELEETSSGATLSQVRWQWGAEAAVGVDLRLASVNPAPATAVGIFLRLEGGYAWSPSSTLSLEANDGGAPVRTAPLGLGEIAIAGPSLRASVGVGF